MTRHETLPPARRYTDLGNGYRLIDRHGAELRYVHAFSQWRVWDGKRWMSDRDGEVERRAIDTVEAIPAECEQAPEDARIAVMKHATASQARPRISAMITQAQALAAGRPEEFDADPWLFNLENGILDLRTGELRPHDRAALCSKLAPVVFDPEATCPTWDRFLRQVLVDDDVISYLQQVIGSALTGVVTDHALFVLLGEGSNGKSTLLKVILSIWGDYGGTAPSELLLRDRRDSHPTIFATLLGRRLVVVNETPDDGRFHDEQVKKLTGGEPVDVRKMHQDWWSFPPTHKLVLATNRFPAVQGRDHGMMRRLKAILFPVIIDEADTDTTFPHRLQQEAPGILNWALEGCRAWQQSGCRLSTPASVRDGLTMLLRATDPIGPFLTARCAIGDDHHAPAEALYAAYAEWCEETGAEDISQKAFGGHLRRRGFTSKPYGQQRRTAWFGIGLDP